MFEAWCVYVVRRPFLFVVCRSLIVARCVLFVGCWVWLLLVARCSVVVVRCVLLVACGLLLIARRLLPVDV